MKYDIKKIGVGIDRLDKAITGNARSLIAAFHWDYTPQGVDYWSAQYHGRTPLDITALKEIRSQYYAAKSPRIEVGKTYAAANDTEWRCIYVEDDRAYMLNAFVNGPAFPWNATTGEALTLSIDHYIRLAPDVRNGRVEYVGGKPDFTTWKESK